MGYKIADNVVFRKIDDEAILLNVDSGHYYTLNNTGSEILEQLIDDKAIEKIAELLSTDFDVDLKSLMADIQEIIDDLINEDIIIDD